MLYDFLTQMFIFELLHKLFQFLTLYEYGF